MAVFINVCVSAAQASLSSQPFSPPCLKQSEEDNSSTSKSIPLHKRPLLKYGTAWKKQHTAEYVYNAVMAGFRHIDTACQPKHYKEPLVGQGWTEAAKELGLERSDFWLQTKYTSVDGQDRRDMPYDPQLPLDE